jgi:hypothetical protein
MVLGFAACTDDTTDNPADGTEVTEEEVENITDDQMAVMVTADLPTAVLRPFDEGSTGAALVKRLSTVTSEFGPDTRMVLVPGTMFDGATDMTDDELDALVQLELDGGYLAIERPTAMQLFNFATLLVAKLMDMQQLQYQELFNLDEAAAARAAKRSQMVQRTQARLSNIEKIAKRRAADTDLNAVQAEMIIYGPTDYFMQQSFEEETTILASETDSEGNKTETTAKTVTLERTAAVSGSLADAAARWLNDVAKSSPQQNAARRALTRAGDDSATDALMERTETFTFNGMLYFSDWQNTTQSCSDRLSIKVSSRSIYNKEDNKDYYYLSENVLISLGKKDGCLQVYYPKAKGSWTRAFGDGGYNCWYGAFLSQYKTSMNLKGNGTVSLEQSAPAANDDSNLKLSQNTDGNRVTWTYDGTLPQFYVKAAYYHDIAADVLVGDVDQTHDICWSVANPTGSFTVELTSAPKLSALMLQSDGTKTPPHKYVERSDNQTYTHELLEPYRVLQTWHMSVGNVEYDENIAQHGTVEDLENALQADFPDHYIPEFQLPDNTETSLSSITSVITNSKSVFGQQSKHLDELAQRFGMKKFEIIYSREGTDQVKSSKAFVYYVCPKAIEATTTHLGWIYGSDGYLYPSADYARGHDATPLGFVAYVNDGSEFGDKATEKASGAGHGLVLLLRHTTELDIRINNSASAIFTSAIGNSMNNAKNDFDGLAKTQSLIGKGSVAASTLSKLGNTPEGCTPWFIPSTGQWIAMLCTPGLGGAEIPTGAALNTHFNINGAAKLSSTSRANGGSALVARLWTSSGFNGNTGIYLVNSTSAPRFSWYNWSNFCWVRPAFAF